MPTFLIVSEKRHEALGRKIQQTYPDDHFDLGSGQWLVEAEKTTQNLAVELDVRGGEFGKAVVFKVETYSGYHNKSLWEWLNLQSGRKNK